MLSLKNLLERKSTLYLGKGVSDAFLRGANIVIVSDNAERAFPLDSVRRVIFVGRSALSCALPPDLARAGIPAEWQDRFGKCVALLWPVGSDWDCLLEAQIEFGKSAEALELARALVLAKVDNCREVLRRRVDSPPDWRPLRAEIAGASSLESLRGHEGYAARIYFSEWRGLLHKFSWRGRQARPAPDPPNMMLSLGYSALRNRLASALRHAGLEPRQGFMHERRGSHPALASDLMEPLRALVDSEVLTIMRRGELGPDDFKILGGRCAAASERCLPLLLRAFEEMFEKTHKFYINPQNPEQFYERSLDDLLDDMAESFAFHLHDRDLCLIPRLQPCAGI